MYIEMAKKVSREANSKSKSVLKKRISKKITRNICGTRFLKNVKYIQSIAPKLVSAEDPVGSIVRKVKPDIIERIHTMDNIRKVIRDPALSSVLEKNRFPSMVFTPDYGRLFNGTFQFVRVTLSAPPIIWTSAVSVADIQTAIGYSQVAITPILLSISNYRTTRVNIETRIIPYSAVSGLVYNDGHVQTWVNDIVSNPNNHLSSNTCIVILAPYRTDGRFRNSSADATGANGYHGKANVPYIFCYVYGQNLTIADRQRYYAGTLSHEIEETIVDPQADLSNPEVADPCWGNCSNLWRSFFDNNDNYIRSVKNNIPTDLAYSYYINAVVQPPWARTNCGTTPPPTIPENACNYEPPTQQEVCERLEFDIEIVRAEIQELEDELANETDQGRIVILRRQIQEKRAALRYYNEQIELFCRSPI
jgi:hypothetical protein